MNPLTPSIIPMITVIGKNNFPNVAPSPLAKVIIPLSTGFLAGLKKLAILEKTPGLAPSPNTTPNRLNSSVTGLKISLIRSPNLATRSNILVSGFKKVLIRFPKFLIPCHASSMYFDIVCINLEFLIRLKKSTTGLKNLFMGSQNFFLRNSFNLMNHSCLFISSKNPNRTITGPTIAAKAVYAKPLSKVMRELSSSVFGFSIFSLASLAAGDILASCLSAF